MSKSESSKRTRHSLKSIQEFAERKGGVCLAKRYTTARVPLLWECHLGHQWRAAFDHIFNRGDWCPWCAGRYKTIDDMSKLAQQFEGECLSKSYKNSVTKLKWQCKNSHVFRLEPAAIVRGTWCQRCSGRKRTIEDMQIIAQERGGECLSKKFKNTKTKLKWRCSAKHEWWAVPSSILRGSWCRECSDEKKRYSIEKMQTIARKKGGECLSTSFKTVKLKLEWRCEFGHIWRTTPDSIINRKSWCPECARQKSLKPKQVMKRRKSIR